MVIEPKKYGILDSLSIPLRCAPVLTILVGIHLIVSGVAPTFQIMATAYFVDTAIHIVQHNADVSRIYLPLLAVVSLIAYSWTSNQLIQFAQVRLETAIREKFRTAIVDKRSRLEYKHIENHETWDIVSRISKNPEHQVRKAFNDVLSVVSVVLRVVGILVLLIAQVWWAAILIVVISAPLFALAVKSGQANYQANREVSKYKRRNEYLAEVLTGRDASHERYLFKYGDHVNKLWHEHYETARNIEYKTERSWYIKMKMGGVLTSLISILILFVLLNPVLSGALSIGMFIALVNGVFGLVGMMSWQLTSLTDQLAKHVEYLKDLTAFAALKEAEGSQELPARPAPVFQSLEFVKVSFTYPGAAQPILNNLSFTLTAGKHYALVGLNGAGKTTITKLMTGLYTDYEGDILLNGISLTDYPAQQRKAFYSVVYQDFAKYNLTFRENIAVGDTAALGVQHHPPIRRAMEQVGLEAVEMKLQKGWHTPLGKVKSDGQDVSGGEWQRIAMARAIVNPAPVRILDEPTSALDPLSESRLYEEFEQLSRGKTTLMISHRLGSTKLADEILVVGEGCIKEQGSHEQLMASGGEYAQMYEKQRSWYQ